VAADAKGIEIVEAGFGLLAGAPDKEVSVLVLDDDIRDDLFKIVILLGLIAFEEAAIGEDGFLDRGGVRVKTVLQNGSMTVLGTTKTFS